METPRIRRVSSLNLLILCALRASLVEIGDFFQWPLQWPAGCVMPKGGDNPVNSVQERGLSSQEQ